jgi:hypothetical protein
VVVVRRLALPLALLVAVLAPAGAEAAPAGWEETASAIAAPWPALQGGDGHFADYVVRRAPSRLRDDYGDAMLGYGLLLTAARTGDPGLRDAGLRALAHAAQENGSKAVAPFRFVALAGGYNVARERFADAPLFTQARADWERVLRGYRLTRLGGRAPVTNKSIVEAVAVLELARTGVRSQASGTVLNAPDAAVAAARRRLATELPRAARGFRRAAGRAGTVAMLGDYPGIPLAYHALAAGFLARAVDLMGGSAPAAARRLLREGSDAAWAFAAPNGDVAYIGRSQAQSWTLPLTAYGAETAAAQPGGASRAARYRALSERAVARLRDGYEVAGEGLFVTPALGQSLRAGIGGLDPYVAAASYNGITLAGLEWAIATAAGDTAAGEIGSDRDGAFKLGAGDGTFAVVRDGDVWFAVKQSRSATADLRYDFGLVALQVRGDGGAWHPVTPLRPRIERRSDSAGPLLDGMAPAGRSLRLGSGGAVAIAARFGSRRRAVRFAPTACGVRLSLRTRARERVEYSGFFAGSPASSGRRVADAVQRLTFSTRAAAHRSRTRGSGSDARITRVRLRFGHPANGKLTIETCAR